MYTKENNGDTVYLTISLRSRGDYRGIFTEPRVLEWRGKYSPIITETEETNCFSIYTHGKILRSKIKYRYSVFFNTKPAISERDITHELIYNVLKCKIFSNIRWTLLFPCLPCELKTHFAVKTSLKIGGEVLKLCIISVSTFEKLSENTDS